MAEANKLLFFVGVIAAILVVSSLAIAQKASLSPTEVAKQTFAAVEKKDTEAFKALMCKYLRDYVEKSERKNDLLQVFMGILELTTPDKNANTSEKIEGDKAKVTFTQKNADGSPWEYSFDLTKEDDRWTGFCLEPKDLEGFQLSDKMNSRLAGAKAIECRTPSTVPQRVESCSRSASKSCRQPVRRVFAPRSRRSSRSRCRSSRASSRR